RHRVCRPHAGRMGWRHEYSEFFFCRIQGRNHRMTGGPESGSGNLLERLSRFLDKPLHEKSRSLYFRWRKLFPRAPFPVRLPSGFWFIARGDHVGSTLMSDLFDPAERAFLQRFLKPGMTVLDIGAHHGFYTLTAARQVG